MTLSEKGYCLAGDGTLDFSHPDIVADMVAPQTPRSAIGWLAFSGSVAMAQETKLDEQAKALIAQMTLDEKIGQMTQVDMDALKKNMGDVE